MGRHLAFAVLALLFADWGFADTQKRYQPDPLAVQRFEKGYRYPQAGWIVLHIEGEPYERGYQHGRLLAPEIAAVIKSFAEEQGHRDPATAWRQTRTLTNALFLRKFEPEYLDEMKGIADGASAGGAKYDGRPVDLVDIVAVNCWPDIETLDSALEALPTGLEGKRFPHRRPRAMPPTPPEHCSAFAATAPATADGKIVFGHITMFGLHSSHQFNVWLDVKPSKGHRVLMQSFPGGIQSGMDYYISSSGILCTETTIRQTRFDITGLALAGRIRKALQYANSIDEAAEILKTANSGLYTNEWLLADIKTNEIAMLELGTHASRLRRSSKGEWFGDTQGFYWGCNNTKDRAVRLETIASLNDRPENVVWEPSDRDQTWLRLFNEHKGKITGDFGRLAFTTAPLAAAHSLDAKYTTSAMAKNLETWALFGPPLGRPWEPTDSEKKRFPDIRPLVSNPWTVLHPQPPAETKLEIAARDIKDKIESDDRKPDDDDVHTQAAWHGTLLPSSDADVWLAAGFAKYERIVSLEDALKEKHTDHKLAAADRERLAVSLDTYRRSYLSAARRSGDTPLAQTKANLGSDWYQIAVGKGTLLLHELRRTIGGAKFDELMEKFGRANAGKEIETAAFVAFLEKEANVTPAFWDVWLHQPGLTAPLPTDKVFSLQSWNAEREKTLIVFGTSDEEAANRQTAEAVQKLIRSSWSNETVPIKADRDVSGDEIKNHHLLLIGRPECNTLTARFRESLPVRFGARSFAVDKEHFAHAGSSVLAAGDNPESLRYSIVVLAGLSADATTRTPELLLGPGTEGANVVIAPHGGKTRPLSTAAKY